MRGGQGGKTIEARVCENDAALLGDGNIVDVEVAREVAKPRNVERLAAGIRRRRVRENVPVTEHPRFRGRPQIGTGKSEAEIGGASEEWPRKEETNGNIETIKKQKTESGT